MKECEFIKIEEQTTREEENDLFSGENENSDNRERRAIGKERVGSKSAQEEHTCWKCGKEGHLKKQCSRWNKGIKPDEHSVGREKLQQMREGTMMMLCYWSQKQASRQMKTGMKDGSLTQVVQFI